MICKSCKNITKNLVYDFGKMPAVNSFIYQYEIKSEQLFDLKLYVCDKCWLVQLSDVPKPEVLFEHYHHISGSSKGNVLHLSDVSKYIKKYYPEKSRVLEIGCNDGTLLNFLYESGYACYGIDPARNISQNSKIKVYKDFFNTKFVEKFIEENGLFDIIVGLNVFAHNDNFISMFDASSQALSENGIFLIEVAYAPSTIGDGNFDTIYHEHVCSYSLFSLENALKSVGLNIIHAQLIETQGGSIRVVAKKKSYETKSQSYEKIKINENKMGIDKLGYYNSIQKKIQIKVESISNFFKNVINNKERLLIIGAPARGVVTINVCNNNSLKNCSVIIDDTYEKQGKVMPGSHISIISWDECRFEDFDICIILSWNYINDLKERIDKTKFKGYIYTPFPNFKRVN